MDKTEKLLRMIEHPELYSDEQLQEMLSDEECRQLYEAMRLSVSAFELVDGEAKVASNLKEEEWKKLETAKFHVGGQKVWMQVAATIIGILMLSGITYAAVQLYASSLSSDTKEKIQTETAAREVSADSNSEKSKDSIQSVRIFENVPLRQIVMVIGQEHHLSTEVQNTSSADLRLYYPWNPQKPLEQVVKELNKFERVNIVVKDQTIIIE